MAILDVVQKLIPDITSHDGKVMAIDESSSSFGYVGLAESGSLKSEAKWRILRVYRQGTVYTIETAPSEDYTNIWDNRESLFTSLPLNNSYSVRFDGVNDYVALGTTNFTDMDIGQQWSQSFWVKVNNYSLQRTIYGKVTVDPYGQMVYISTGGVVVVHVRTSGYSYTRTGTQVLTTGVWHHIVVTYSGSQNVSGFKIYIDGVEDASAGAGVLTTSLHAGQPATIGARGGYSTYFSGFIDEVSFWLKQLTASEVLETYNSGQPGDLSDHSAYNNLRNWWRMGDSDTFPTLLDSKGSDNGTMTNQVSGDIFGDVP